MPFPPHQCNVKVLCIQCLQTCLTNRDFDKVLAKTGASTGARVGESESIKLLSFSLCIHKIRKCQLLGPESRWFIAHWPASLGSVDVYFCNVPSKETEEEDIHHSEIWKFTWSLGEWRRHCNSGRKHTSAVGAQLFSLLLPTAWTICVDPIALLRPFPEQNSLPVCQLLVIFDIKQCLFQLAQRFIAVMGINGSQWISATMTKRQVKGLKVFLSVICDMANRRMIMMMVDQ